MTKLIQGPHNTLRFLNSAKLSYGKPWIQVYPNTIRDKWYVGDFSSATYNITVEFDSNQKETFQLLVTALSNQANYIVYNKSSIQDPLVLISVQIDQTQVSVIVDPTTNFSGARLLFSVVYAETINALLIPTTLTPTVNQIPFSSSGGFASPGFNVDTSGNVNITGDFKKDGVSIGFGGTTLPSSIIYSSLSTLGTLSSLIVDTTPLLNGTPGSIIINGNGVNSTINNVRIGNLVPTTGNFTEVSSTVSLSAVSGSVTITPSIIGTIDNTTIGEINPQSGKFTNISITTTPSNLSHATTKNYVDSADAAVKLNATALAIALGS